MSIIIRSSPVSREDSPEGTRSLLWWKRFVEDIFWAWSETVGKYWMLRVVRMKKMTWQVQEDVSRDKTGVADDMIPSPSARKVDARTKTENNAEQNKATPKPWAGTSIIFSETLRGKKKISRWKAVRRRSSNDTHRPLWRNDTTEDVVYLADADADAVQCNTDEWAGDVKRMDKAAYVLLTHSSWPQYSSFFGR